MIARSLTAMLLALAVAPAPTTRAGNDKYQVVPVESGGSITGIVRLHGTVPETKILETPTPDEVCHKKPIPDESLVVSKDKGVRWAVVSIANITQGKAFPEDSPALDQEGCRFVPHVVVVPENTELSVLNSDGVLHNVRTHSLKNAPVNRSMPRDVTKLSLRFRHNEAISVTCDVHAWMKAWIIVAPNPYYAVTDEKGEFHLDDVPPGQYELRVWHETLVQQETKVEVQANTTSNVDFELEPKK